MKKRVLAALAVLFAMMISAWCFAEEETAEILSSGEWEYYINDDGMATISSCNTDDEKLVIPEEIDGLQVTEIGEDAFHGCSSLTSVEIPESVTEIGEDAFSICSSLTSIEIPESVIEIGEDAFFGCRSLVSISVSPENKNYAAIDNVLFEKSSKTLICYPYGSTENEYAIPEGITAIGENAFHDCSSLASIEIPESVTEIGECAFTLCSSLTSIEIPESVTAIKDFTFSNCSSLTSIEIPESVASIGEYAFSNCRSLKSIEIPESVTEIGENAFHDCSTLTLIVERDSYAAQYAKENDIPYTFPDANDWLND